MIKDIINLAVAYLQLGIEFLMNHLITFEGVIVLLLGVFFIGLISSLRG